MFLVLVICALFGLSLSTSTTTPSILPTTTEPNHTGGLSEHVIQIIIILVVCFIAVSLSYYCVHKEEQKDLNRLREVSREADLYIHHANLYKNLHIKRNPAYLEPEEEDTQMEYHNTTVLFDTSEESV